MFNTEKKCNVGFYWT